MSERPHVVVIGAGFAGLWAVKALAREPVDVTLIDRNNYHSFFPLLYQVAAAELDPGDIAYPIRAIIRRYTNVAFLLADVTGADLDAHVLQTTRGDVHFDALIIATGSTTRYFGVPGAAEHALPLRTLDDGIKLKHHLLRAIEAAAGPTVDEFTGRHLANPTLRAVVIGGGPTGVEFSGALAELVRGPLRKENRTLAAAGFEIVLVEAGPHVLAPYPERLRRYALRRLRKKGIDVRLDAAVAEIGPERVVLADGSTIEAATIVWTAGVGGQPELADLGADIGRGDKAVVSDTLQLAAHPAVFVAGDGADVGDTFAPMVAQNASQQGSLAARNAVRFLDGRALETYTYRDLGNMAVIGRNAAVVHLFNRIALTGWIAWIIWLALHLMKLVGFRNRVSALISWAGDYIFQSREARLIIGGPDRSHPRG